MAIKEPEAPLVGAKGLQAGALGLVGNVVIGLAAVAPDVVLVVREEMPDGLTLESALKKLNWDDADLFVVGSSRFAAPRRIFLGSTAARILAGTDSPVIVVPPPPPYDA